MKKGVNKRFYFIIGSPFLALAIILTGFLFITNPSVSISPQHSEATQYDGIVCLTITRADGTVENLDCKHNLVYNDGLEMFEDSIAHGVNLSSRSIALCNSTLGTNCGAIAADQSEVFLRYSTCGLSPTNGTYANLATTSGNWSIYATFTNSCAHSVDINASRLGNERTQRNFSGARFSSLVTLAQNDQLTVNWTIMGSSG